MIENEDALFQLTARSVAFDIDQRNVTNGLRIYLRGGLDVSPKWSDESDILNRAATIKDGLSKHKRQWNDCVADRL